MTDRAVSTIPLVLDYLVSRCTSNMPNVKVTDGQPKPPEDAEPDLLCIGFTGTLGEPAVENSRSKQQAATSPDRETYEVTCLASSWKGNETDASDVRDAAFEILYQVARIVAQDQTLGGLVMRARILTDLLAQEQTTMGAVATIRFVLQIDAFTR